MSGIFCSYLADTRLARTGRLAYLLILIFAIISTGTADFISTIALLPMGFMIFLGLESRLDRYLRVMPIKSSTIVLAKYIHILASLLVGVVAALVLVLIFHDYDRAVRLHFIMLVTGAFLMCVGVAEITLLFHKRNVWWYIWQFVLIWSVPVGMLYIVLGAGTIHDIVRRRMQGVPITSAEVFTNTNTWIVYIAVSVAVFVVSYFAALAAYRKSDYVQLYWWERLV